ncbi:MAG: ribonuclease HII [Alphaproteobacteria bacterium]|nr:ribonuclease HII [Alphaproteobacteria bacterium]
MPDFSFEDQFSGVICGIDEAGRGPWVGNVVAGAVIIKDRNLAPELLNHLNDSKKLSKTKREQLYSLLCEAEAQGQIKIGIGEATPLEIDQYNILQATFMAMRRAAQNLGCSIDMALIDGNQTPQNFPCNVQTIVKGDARSYSISAASIIAKVYRDKEMEKLAEKYPFYGFEHNAGYGTKDHIDGIKKHGLIAEHRKSYKPIKAFL